MPDVAVSQPEPDGSGDPFVGTLLDERYLIEGLIGRGGMASVYRAHDQLLGRTVAVKLFQVGIGEPRDLRREIGEIRTLASLNHHALVTLFDASVTNTRASEHAYLVMEYVGGPNLRTRLEHGPLPADVVAAMTTDLAEALHVVHGRGVVHRDIKPDNVLLSPSPTPDREFRAKLADFGIALLGDSTRLTLPGTVMGTAAYVSPEQAQGTAAGAPSDVYSLGLVLLESFTGVRAFPGTMLESITAKLTIDPEVPDDVGAEWKALLLAMTARDPQDRPSAWEVAETAGTLGIPGQDAPAQNDATTATAPYTPTLVMEAPAPEFFDDAAQTTKIESSTSVEEAVAPRRRVVLARRWWLVLAAILVAAIAVTIIILNLPSASTPSPTLPALGGPLGAHLKQLLDSVTP